MVQLRRSEHADTGLVAVSLLPEHEDRAAIIAPGRVRVVEREVADRLARLLGAVVEHARAAGRPLELDLDRLADRAAADVAARRGRS